MTATRRVLDGGRMRSVFMRMACGLAISGAVAGWSPSVAISLPQPPDVSVRPVLDARPGPCDAAEFPPPDAQDSGHYALEVGAQKAQEAPTTSFLCIHVGAAGVVTSDFQSGTLTGASLFRGGQQVGWAVDLTLTSTGAERMAALAFACQRTDPECPASLGGGGHLIIAFRDAPISTPIVGADFTIPANRTLTLMVPGEDAALTLSDLIGAAANSGDTLEEGNPQPSWSENFFVVAFLVFATAVVAMFVWATVRNARRYEESLRPPDDLRRVGDPRSPAGGGPSGGDIWPSP